MDKKAKITVDESAINIDNQKSNLSFDRRPFTKTIVEMGKYANMLDLYDDFDALRIDPSCYIKKEGEYGIAYDKGVHGASLDGQTVILSHQQKAATRFLKELRGFGLLADVVGSGKTFEAGVVLSELAARGRARSVLIVAPDQVYDTWVTTMETKFGLGKGAFLHAGPEFFDVDDIRDYLKTANGFTYIARPVIVKMEDFVQWRFNETLSKLLFDVIIVDEAHNLCLKDHSQVNGLQLLSRFMKTKKKAGYPYCLLLSATPHNGDLSDMFRLWYFIRFKGGDYKDFADDDRGASDAYKEEKRHYLTDVCYGATTVMEFIQKVRVKKVESKYMDLLNSFKPDYAKLSEAGRIKACEDFVNSDKLSESQKSSIEKEIANAYHNEVLRPIMIRQPNHLPKTKSVRNIFYYPSKAGENSRFSVNYFEETIEIDASFMDEEAEFMKTETEGTMNFNEYRRFVGNDRKFSDLLFAVLKQIDGGMENKAFPVDGAKAYYRNQLERCERNGNTYLHNAFAITQGKNVVDLKIEQTKKIIKEHAEDKIIIFFDYELNARESSKETLKSALLADPQISSRLVDYVHNNKEKTIANFNAKVGAILLVEDAALTEGSNLQESSIIINFEVTTDPLSMEQRIGRIFRLGQKHNVTIYSLADMTRIEGFTLMYYSSIGLLNSNSGDASIIAGSNNDKNVTIKCNACGRVRMVSKALYEEEKKAGKGDSAFCKDTVKCCSHGSEGTLMSEISNFNFECDTCHIVLQRDFNDDEAGTYRCVSTNLEGGKGKMCNSGLPGDRSYFCNNTCALSNCQVLNRIGCPLIALVKKGITSDTTLFNACWSCRKREECEAKAKFSGEPCAYFRKGFSSNEGGEKAVIDAKKHQIAKCMRCDNAGCRPKPHILDFTPEWVAECPDPNCRGHLKKVNAGTFNTYVKSLWRFSTKNKNQSSLFTDDLEQESKRVAEIKTILDMDEENEED